MTDDNDENLTFECTCVTCGAVSHITHGLTGEMDFTIIRVNRHAYTKKVICSGCKKTIKDICGVDLIVARCATVEKSISGHALGVQNVYNEIKELREFYKSKDCLDDFRRAVEDMNQIKKDIGVLQENYTNLLHKEERLMGKLMQLLGALHD